MNDAAPGWHDLEQRMRIQRSLEQRLKFIAEQQKLIERAAKFRVERTIYPAALVLGFIGAILGTLLTHVFR